MTDPPPATESQKFEQVVQIVAPQSKLLRTWPLKGGISAEMVVLEVEEPGGQTRRMILRRHSIGQQRQNPRSAEGEFRLLQITHSLELATPAPYHFDLSGSIFSTPYLVIEYVEGKMEFSPTNLDDYILKLAVQLAKIHSVDPSNHDLTFLPEIADGCAEFRRERSAKVGSPLDEERIQATLESVRPLTQRNAPALLHGDFWPGNILWQGDRLAAVIDWEDAGLGDPLIDLAKSRSEIAWIFGFKAMNAFTHHYQSLMAIDDSQLPYFDLCAALRLARIANFNLASLAAFIIPFGRDDITEQTISGNYGRFIGQAFEKLHA